MKKGKTMVLEIIVIIETIILAYAVHKYRKLSNSFKGFRKLAQFLLEEKSKDIDSLEHEIKKYEETQEEFIDKIRNYD
jgi:hypothetical protein